MFVVLEEHVHEILRYYATTEFYQLFNSKDVIIKASKYIKTKWHKANNVMS